MHQPTKRMAPEILLIFSLKKRVYLGGVLDNVTICVDITCSSVRIVANPGSLLLKDKPLHLINYYSRPWQATEVNFAVFVYYSFSSAV